MNSFGHFSFWKQNVQSRNMLGTERKKMVLVETALVETTLVKTTLVKATLEETTLVETTLV